MLDYKVWDRLNIVAPDKSMEGRVKELFQKSGLPISFEKERSNIGKVAGRWINKVVFERPQEIPELIAAGYFDVAIVGEDWIADWGYEFPVLLSMAIGRSKNQAVRIVLAVPKSCEVKDCMGRPAYDVPYAGVVFTEYVRLTKKYFESIGRSDVKIKASHGNTEAKVRYGADGIVDVTETGASLEANGLIVISTLMESNTVIIANPDSLADEEKKQRIEWFVRLIKGAYAAIAYMKIIANVPEEILKQAAEIVGGLKGPTCAPIYGKEGWFALSAIVPKSQWDRISFELLQIGVTDIIPKWDIPCIMT